MLRTAVADRLRAEYGEDGYLFPAYDDYCFARVPDTVLDALGADAARPLPGDVFDGVPTDVDHVALVLVDGYGFEQWRRDRDELAFLRRLESRGTVTPLTSVFPSETAAAITTVHTGRQPVEHGLLGWFQYHAALGDIVQTLPFATSDGTPLSEALPDADPSWLFDGGPPTVYERARAAGVQTECVLPAGIPEGAHSTLALRGVSATGYEGLDALVSGMRDRLESADGPTYCYGYAPHVDAEGHRTGTESDAYRETVATVLSHVRRGLVDELSPDVAERTLLVVTADHGQVNTDPAGNVALSSLDGVTEHLRRDADGNPVPVDGSPRQLQFSVRDGHVAPLRASLESRLDCRTFDRAEMRDRGLYGTRSPSDRYAAREPDLLVVPRDRGVWHEDPLDELSLVGMHGGLHPDEMLVPFAAARVADLA